MLTSFQCTFAFVPDSPHGVELKYALGVDILQSEDRGTVLDGCEFEETTAGFGT